MSDNADMPLDPIEERNRLAVTRNLERAGEAPLKAYEEPAPAGPMGLIFAGSPDEFMSKAVGIAKTLARVVEEQKLFSMIGSGARAKKHVHVEGWTLLGSMLGVFPVCVWSRPIDGGYEARVEARTLGGEVVGAAEAQCTRSEQRWARADDYAIRSMAQTRATSKALRQPLDFVMVLAGYSATPQEEMPEQKPDPPQTISLREIAGIRAAIQACCDAGRPTDEAKVCAWQKVNELKDIPRAKLAAVLTELLSMKEAKR